jgi:hypothetical protein
LCCAQGQIHFGGDLAQLLDWRVSPRRLELANFSSAQDNWHEQTTMLRINSAKSLREKSHKQEEELLLTTNC